MDYERRYKDALRRAKKLYEQGTITECLGWVFPELKESDDARIKREILKLVSISGNGNQYEEIKDWLKKQGENKPTYKAEPKTLDADKVIAWLLTHGILNDSDIQSHAIPDDSPTSILHKTRWLSDSFIERFKMEEINN